MMNPTRQITTQAFRIWDPQRHHRESLTLIAASLLSITDSNTPTLAGLFVTAGRTGNWYVPADKIGSFLATYRAAKIVFAKAGDDFWSIHRLLREQDNAAARAWRRRLATGRFSSVSLLDQLVRLASGEGGDDESIPPRPLDVIGVEYGVSIKAIPLTEKQRRGLDIAPDTLLQAARRVLRVFEVAKALRGEAKHLTQQFCSEKNTIPQERARYGLLTETLQAAAEIAFARMSRRGVAVDVDAHEQLQQSALTAQQRSAETLAEIAPGLLIQTRGEFAQTPTGMIRRNDAELEQQLRQVAERMRAPAPLNRNGRLSRSPRDWAAFAPRSRFVLAWKALDDEQSRLHWLRQLAGPRLHPTYTTLIRTGRASCANPPLQGLPRGGGIRELLVPRPGYAFLTVDYTCFELCALAAICRHRFGESRLANILEKGHDLHIWTAAKLTERSYKRMLKLQETSSKKFRRLRDRAKPINFGIPGGMSAATLVEYARDAFGANITLQEAETFRRKLIDEIYPELRHFLAESEPVTVTLTGRIRGGVSYTAQKNSQFQGLAADAAKLALVRLIAAGHRVVLFVHDEFVIEIPADHAKVDEALVQEIVGLVQTAASEVVGLPVLCEATVSSCWSKSAQRLPTRRGRIPVWTPD